MDISNKHGSKSRTSIKFIKYYHQVPKLFILQTLPLDDRNLYESALQPGESPCLITGYPVRKQAVIFPKTNLQANKDVWSKLNMGAKMAPESNVSNVLSFMTKWCGSPN